MPTTTFAVSAKLREATSIRFTFGKPARPPLAAQGQAHPQPLFREPLRMQTRSAVSVPLFGLLVL